MKMYALLIFVVLTLVSCDDSTNSIALPSAEKQSIVCLLDISGSTKEFNLSSFIDNIAGEVISNLNESTSVVILAIDNGSQTAAKPLYSLDMTQMSFVNESLPMTIRKKVAKIKRTEFIDSIKLTFRAEVMKNIEERKAYATHTDIFGSLMQVKRFSSYSTKVLIFSDMLNYSEDFNMEKLVKENKDLMDQNHAVPKILGDRQVEVYVSTGNSVELGTKKFKMIKVFWTRYFSENNYQLVVYTSGNLRL